MPDIITVTSTATSISPSALFKALEDANATRYLTAAGLVVLLYDHILTLPDEIRLVWPVRRSFAKYAFLLNRYLVLGCVLAVAYEMYSNNKQGCRKFLFTCSLFALLSVAIANILVILRVIILWEHRPMIVKLMIGGFCATFSAQVATMLVSLVHLVRGVFWSPEAGMCILTVSTPIFIAVWASPMLFEILVLIATIVNALDRPRGPHQRLTNALSRDGITYFLALTLFRALNLAFAATLNPSLTMLGSFFVWSLTTTVLNRSILRLRDAEVAERIPPTSGRASPFTFGRPLHQSASSVSTVLTYNNSRSIDLRKFDSPVDSLRKYSFVH
ncbi:hypothetical protein C8Q75DRAFT_806253 [Abortiporus biennis]|nr:hypothetical protein C8Q75DRAFT_806253 [Abortiporus biennis]